ncbi:MAG: septum formation initiator family protein [Prevotella sp.]|nr:septum formation initiator family protein [Prevotella sp.]
MKFIQRLGRLFSRYKYLIVIVVGVILIGFVGENSMWNGRKLNRQIKELNNQIDSLQSKYNADSIRLSELERNPGAIEKIARERYFMKTDDEDIFMLSDDNNE